MQSINPKARSSKQVLNLWSLETSNKRTAMWMTVLYVLRLGAMESNHYIQIQSLLSCH